MSEKSYEQIVEERFIKDNKHKPILTIQRLKCPNCNGKIQNIFKFDYLECPYCYQFFDKKRKLFLKYIKIRNPNYQRKGV